MANRDIHKQQPLARRSKTLHDAGSISSFHCLPRWKKYLKFGLIAEELGKKQSAEAWRRKGFRSAIEDGEYAVAGAWATLYLSGKEAKIANSLALLKENISTGRTNADLYFLVLDALSSEAPLELVISELSRPIHQVPAFNKGPGPNPFENR
jgi:hypothetical protein